MTERLHIIGVYENKLTHAFLNIDSGKIEEEKTLVELTSEEQKTLYNRGFRYSFYYENSLSNRNQCINIDGKDVICEGRKYPPTWNDITKEEEFFVMMYCQWLLFTKYEKGEIKWD